MIESIESKIPNKDSSQDPGDHANWLSYAKMLTHLYMKITIRLNEKKLLPKFHTILKGLYKKSYKLSLWLIDNFNLVSAIREFLIDCPVLDMKYKSQLYNSPGNLFLKF